MNYLEISFFPHMPLTAYRCKISYPRRSDLVSPRWWGTPVPWRREAVLAPLCNHRQRFVSRYISILVSQSCTSWVSTTSKLWLCSNCCHVQTRVHQICKCGHCRRKTNHKRSDDCDNFTIVRRWSESTTIHWKYFAERRYLTEILHSLYAKTLMPQLYTMKVWTKW